MNNDNEWKIVFLIILVLSLQLVGYILFPNKAKAADSSIYIDSVGSNNTIIISQDGTEHLAAVSVGATLPTNSNDLKTGYGIGTRNYLGSGSSDYNYVSISQQGLGFKTSTVEIPNGANNNITLYQDGLGNHTAAIQNLQGNNNAISVSQDGSGNHTFNVINGTGTANSNNNVTGVQTGSGDKSFTLNMNGTNGATVSVQQTNPTQANSGSMSIQCTTCGSYSYTRQ